MQRHQELEWSASADSEADVEREAREDWFLVYRVLSDFPDAFRALEEALLRRRETAAGRQVIPVLCWNCKGPVKEGAEGHANETR